MRSILCSLPLADPIATDIGPDGRKAATFSHPNRRA
jgi:hypothetical protein